MINAAAIVCRNAQKPLYCTAIKICKLHLIQDTSDSTMRPEIASHKDNSVSSLDHKHTIM